MRNACKYFNSHNYISNYQASTPFYENMRNENQKYASEDRANIENQQPK